MSSEKQFLLETTPKTELVILVDQGGHEIGTAEKMAVHRSGQLHLAFSIFVVNSQGQILLQQRALDKYHSGGLWTNTCCSHPRPQEALLDAAHRRLQEEMGFDCELFSLFNFTYCAHLDGDLIEHEYDYVLLGEFDGEPIPNPEEVAQWKWIDRDLLQQEISQNPDRYTYWLRNCFDRFLESWTKLT